jgi:hypothetical protein
VPWQHPPVVAGTACGLLMRGTSYLSHLARLYS